MKRWIALLILCMLVITAAGCWDVREIGTRAFVMAVALDSGSKGENYKVTFAILNPKLQKKYLDQPTTTLQTVEVDSIPQAVEKIQSRISRHIDMAHTRVILVGEEKARDSFLDIIDYLQRNPGVQMRVQLMFVQGREAEDILKLEPVMERDVPDELIALSRMEREQPCVRTATFCDFTSELRTSNGRGLGARVLASEKEEYFIWNGAAVFDHWKLAGWLSHEEMKGANWILQPWEAILEGKIGESIYTYQVQKKRTRIVAHTDGPLRFTVHISTNGMILQQQGKRLKLNQQENITKLENLFARTIEAQVKEAIFKAQKELGIDYLGFERELEMQAPQELKKYNWEEKFPTIPIDVQVESRLLSIGMIE